MTSRPMPVQEIVLGLVIFASSIAYLVWLVKRKL